MTDAALHYRSATDLAAAIRRRELSVSEVLEVHLSRIETVDPSLNAIPTRCDDQARAQAAAIDRAFQPEGKILYGLPIAIKDLALTRGIRTTFGSPLHADFVPDEDDLFVARLKDAGAIIVGKTNTPEFGAGSQTFNPVFGATRNPYDRTKTCGGSSGGAAVALASGMLPLADGSDLGGSLRNPAAFCNVVGLRPSPGRVPLWPKQFSSDPLAVAGPMARSVQDAALLLAAMAGPDARVPISLADPGERFLAPLARDFRGAKIAYSIDLGQFEVEPEIRASLETNLSVIENLGAHIEPACPDLSDTAEAFNTLRAWSFAARFGPQFEAQRHAMKDTVVWNIEQGLRLTVTDITNAESKRSKLIAQVAEFFEDYDFLICPATQVLPFDIEQEWVQDINGKTMPTYLDWMGVCWAITVTGCPAISVPAGFSDSGLPIGVQIVAPRWRDFELLQFAHAFECATRWADRHPDI